MPICFCCRRCGQTLAIGRRKAGTQVDCPKCGQTQIVPPPPPEPAVDTPQEPPVAAESAAPRPAEDEAEPEVVIVYDEVGPASVPLRRGLRASGWSRRERGPQWVVFRRSTVYLQAVLILVVGVVALAAGYFIGRHDASVELVAGRAGTAGEPVLVEGTLSYQIARGEKVGDAGAVAVFLPVGRQPESTIPTAGLRPEDPAGSSEAQGLARLGELGGAWAKADRQGLFSVVLPAPGRYHVLLVSASARRPDDVLIEQIDLDELKHYFRKPVDLVGRQKYHWAPRDFQGRTRLDHNFGPSGQ